MKSKRVNNIEYEVYSPGQSIIKLLSDPWKNWLLPTSWLIKLTTLSRSRLIEETRRNPGSWKSMEIVYENLAPVDWLDRMALCDNPISMAVRNRRKFVVAELTKLISQLPSDSTVNLLGVGAGPGLQAQEAILRSRISLNRIRAVFIDRDDTAFAHGKTLATERGIADCLTYIQGDVRDALHTIPDIRFDIVKLVGIIEYLSDETVVELCSTIRKRMKPSATILTHGIVDAHRAMPFLQRVFGLHHIQRDGEQVKELLRAAGFEDLSLTLLPMNVYPMVTGKSAAGAISKKELCQSASQN